MVTQAEYIHGLCLQGTRETLINIQGIRCPGPALKEVPPDTCIGRYRYITFFRLSTFHCSSMQNNMKITLILCLFSGLMETN